MYYTFDDGKLHEKSFLYVASIFFPQIKTCKEKSLAYLSFLKLGVRKLTNYFRFCTCCCVEGNFCHQVDLYFWLIAVEIGVCFTFGCSLRVLLDYFYDIAENSTFFTLFVKDVDCQGSKKILCFDVDLPIVECLQLLYFVVVFVFAEGLKIEDFLIGVQYFNIICGPLDGCISDFTIFCGFVFVAI